MKKANYPDEEYEIMNSYLSGIADTDMALEKLYTYINQQKEPVILILFGDHNPWLGENNSVYDMLGINLNLESVDGGENYYETPYLFYANQAAKETLGKDFVGTGNTISPMFLMSELFDYIEIEGPRYLNYLSDVKKEVDVKNPVYVKQNGEYIQTKLLQEKQKLQEVENIEYYMKKQKVK